jgi:flagellar hook-associated protein 2
MSTSSSAVSSSPVTAPVSGFTGVSKFATSLQQVLTRAVAIASLPLNTLQAGLTTLDDQRSALQALDTPFLNLQQSITALQTAVSTTTLNSSVSSSGIAIATINPKTATAGSYSIEVTELGSYSTALGTAGATPVTDPTTQGISSATSFTLTVGANAIPITAASTSLDDLVTAINNQAGGQVQAAIVNVGSTISPDYRLSLQTTTLGAQALDLTDSNGNDYIASSAQGALASYLVDGQVTAITSDTRNITLAPGLTVDLLGQSASGQATTITVSNSSAGLSSAFTSFASAYNASVDAVGQQVGQSAGALAGNSIVYQLSSVLNQLGTYSNGSPESSLANFGITVDSTGQIALNSTTFAQAASSDFAGLLSTLGGTTTGGFLQAANNLLTGVEDPNTGIITDAEASTASAIATQQTAISNEQATVNQLQTNLTQQISNADAAIASLESQVSFVSGLFASYTGYNPNSANNNGLPTL